MPRFSYERPSIQKEVKRALPIALIAAGCALFGGKTALGQEALKQSTHDIQVTENQNNRPERKQIISKEEYLQYLIAEESLSATEQQELKDKIDFLAERYPPEIFSLLQITDQRAQEQRHEGEPQPPLIEGFEHLGLRNQDLLRLWYPEGYPKDTAPTYPRGSRVSKIIFHADSTNVSPPHAYNLPDSVGPLIAQALTDGVIHIYAHPQLTSQIDGPQLVYLLDVIRSHEVEGHSENFLNNNAMPPRGRIELLHDITKIRELPRIYNDEQLQEASKQNQSLENILLSMEYVNAISNDNKRVEYWLQTLEGWAIKVQLYFFEPEALQIYFPNDYKLVDDFIKTMDPNYDPVTSLETRRVLYRFFNIKKE